MTLHKTKKKIKSRKSKSVSNPAWIDKIDKILGRTRVAKDSITITVMDGVIQLTGTKLAESYSELHELLENKLAKLKIEFQPNNTNKKYILNRPSGSEKEESRQEEIIRARRRQRGESP